MAVISTHSCHGLISACPSSERSRAGREERTGHHRCRAGHHTSTPVSPGEVLQLWHVPVWVSAAVLCDTLMPEQPDTYINLAEDDVNDAANHYEEIEDIPGVAEVALPGKSQRRGVNIQGLG